MLCPSWADPLVRRLPIPAPAETTGEPGADIPYPRQLVTINSGSSYGSSEWADYLADTGWDADSPPPQDPQFVDASANDFSLQAGSPAIDAGAPEAMRTLDFVGNSIVGAPDIGAFEYQGD